LSQFENTMDKHYLDVNQIAGFASIKKLKEATKSNYQQTQKYLQTIDSYTKTKKVIRKFKRLPIIARHSGELMQVDLFDLSKLSRFNRGFKWVLLGTDTISKRLYLIPLKSKKGSEVAKGLKRIIEREPRCKLILSDLGPEFYNKHVTQEILNPYNIKLYSTFSGQKASQSERYGRWLKTRLERYFIYTGQNKWIDILETLETVFNNTKHSRTLIEPNKVNKYNEMEVVARLFPKVKHEPPKLTFGQHVRILKSTNIFAKKTKAQFSDEIFEVYGINYGNPTTYKIKDLKGEPVIGTIYYQELSPVSKTSPITKVNVLAYKTRNRRRYVNIKKSENDKATWESLINFNQKIRDGIYEKI
jgi:hypothetical protein